ncbi:MAG: hypothetical protein ACI90V_009564, partial [Bacillariaceae sp.]
GIGENKKCDVLFEKNEGGGSEEIKVWRGKFFF